MMIQSWPPRYPCWPARDHELEMLEEAVRQAEREAHKARLRRRLRELGQPDPTRPCLPPIVTSHDRASFEKILEIARHKICPGYG